MFKALRERSFANSPLKMLAASWWDIPKVNKEKPDAGQSVVITAYDVLLEFSKITSQVHADD